MREMAENKNKEYSTGSSDSFDLFSAFDGIDTVPADKPVESEPETTAKTEPKAADASDEIRSETAENTAESKPTAKKKKNPIFAVICALLCVAIVVCSTLSFMNIRAAMNPAVEPEEENADEAINIYADMIAKYSDTQYPKGIQQTLTKAYASNNDLVGWLYIPGTAVNTPVVQSKDNSYYLRNNFFGQYTKYGTTYADYRCKKSELTANTVIYGHNMPSGTHFYDVSRFEDIEWYKKHPVIKYSTLYGDYTYLIYAAFYTTALTKYNGGYFFNYIYPNMGPSSLAGYIKAIDERAIYKTGISASSADKFITLSTCTHSLDAACGRDIDGRLVVVGRLLRSGESEDVDTSKAKDNPDYRRPQIWYDVKGKKNPYEKSVTWVPSAK